MSGGKETPRQKMIGMMYLVLTALLAMNISKDVLLAFITVQEGLEATNENFDKKNELLYAKLDKMEFDNKVKVKPFNDKAKKIKKEAEELCKFIEQEKKEIFKLAQPELTPQMLDTFSIRYCTAQDNYDIPTHYLIGPEIAHPTGKGVEIKKKIAEFKELLIKSAPPKATLKLGLNTADVYDHHAEKVVPWEVSNFDHTTMAACMCLLEGIKNEVKNGESDVVSLLMKAVNENDFTFDAIEAKVVAPTSYVLSGEKYEADIFVSAHSSTQNPEVIVGSGTNVPVTDGVGKYSVSTGAEGLQEYKGVIKVKAPDGSVKSYPFEGSYMVAKPAMAVSPTKMNVFYIGVDNPVDITVAGASPTDVQATISGGGGSIDNKGQGHYIVRVASGNECSVNVAIKTKTGSKTMGSMKFRVKKVPSPQASYAGVVGDGKVSKGEIAAAGGVIPKLEDFVFDLTFPVVSWNMSVFVNGVYVDYTANGAPATAQMKSVLDKVKTGQKVMIEEVKVKAPDGVRKIPGCVLKIK